MLLFCYDDILSSSSYPNLRYILVYGLLRIRIQYILRWVDGLTYLPSLFDTISIISCENGESSRSSV